MDTGSACSSYNIYGQMVYWVVTPWILTTEHSQLITGLFFSYMEYGCLLLGDEAIYYTKWWWWHYMLLYVVMISTTRYHDDVAIHQWNSYLLHTSHVDYTVSSSDVAIIDVCIYFAQRFAPIIIFNYAGSVGNYFLLMTHMCCVMSCFVL